jgi:4-hydroxy-4-methyl-2-oxoglutarate aldolase
VKKVVNWVPKEVFTLLERHDTPTVSNAIESFNVRLRSEGHVSGQIRPAFPINGSVAGYAVTGRLRTATPPIANLCYYHRMDWWEYVASIPEPKIIVLQDVDHAPGAGALFGEIHAQIARVLGCAAFVTNGAVRDVPALQKLDFPCFSEGISVSHSYAHIIEFGEPVEIGGLKISERDLLQADFHGVHSIPLEVAGQLGREIDRVMAREAELIALCQSSNRGKDAQHTSFLAKLKLACEGSHEIQPQTRSSAQAKSPTRSR